MDAGNAVQSIVGGIVHRASLDPLPRIVFISHVAARIILIDVLLLLHVLLSGIDVGYPQ